MEAIHARAKGALCVTDGLGGSPSYVQLLTCRELVKAANGLSPWRPADKIEVLQHSVQVDKNGDDKCGSIAGPPNGLRP